MLKTEQNFIEDTRLGKKCQKTSGRYFLTLTVFYKFESLFW